MKDILQETWMIEMIRTLTNMYNHGWDERNGGNVSMLLDEEQVADCLDTGKVIRIIPGVLELTLVFNTGAAFGLGQGGQMLFTAMAFLISVGVLIWLYRSIRGAGGFLRQAALVLILAGALGNALDRIRWHYVIDFIYIRLIDFPVFNVADICVTVGCVLLLLDMVVGDKGSVES